MTNISLSIATMADTMTKEGKCLDTPEVTVFSKQKLSRKQFGGAGAFRNNCGKLWKTPWRSGEVEMVNKINT